MERCDIEAIVAFIDGELPLPDAARLREHLKECPSCGALYEDLTAMQDGFQAMEVEPPDTLARGVVYKMSLGDDPPRKSRVLRSLFAVAACVAAVLLITRTMNILTIYNSDKADESKALLEMADAGKAEPENGEPNDLSSSIFGTGGQGDGGNAPQEAPPAENEDRGRPEGSGGAPAPDALMPSPPESETARHDSREAFYDAAKNVKNAYENFEELTWYYDFANVVDDVVLEEIFVSPYYVALYYGDKMVNRGIGAESLTILLNRVDDSVDVNVPLWLLERYPEETFFEIEKVFIN
ncbi:MAG: zf-HC2 domain-containing protein [Oscillospiraceae bacterium]|nr:zf-HC2 domain-containing protein [Oscillospiraceae bacterium]